MPQLSADPVTELANMILHDTWDPSVRLTLAFQLYWKGSDPARLDFAEGHLKEALATLVRETVEQVDGFLNAVLDRLAPAKSAGKG